MCTCHGTLRSVLWRASEQWHCSATEICKALEDRVSGRDGNYGGLAPAPKWSQLYVKGELSGFQTFGIKKVNLSSATSHPVCSSESLCNVPLVFLCLVPTEGEEFFLLGNTRKTDNSSKIVSICKCGCSVTNELNWCILIAASTT